MKKKPRQFKRWAIKSHSYSNFSLQESTEVINKVYSKKFAFLQFILSGCLFFKYDQIMNCKRITIEIFANLLATSPVWRANS
jgi:hypothetical protein